MAREMKDSGIPWVGKIPNNWDVKRGKVILTLLERPIKPDDGVITCFRDGMVTLRSNRREDGFTISLQETGYQGVEPGDLVVHGMDGFAGAIFARPDLAEIAINEEGVLWQCGGEHILTSLETFRSFFHRLGNNKSLSSVWIKCALR